MITHKRILCTLLAFDIVYTLFLPTIFKGRSILPMLFLSSNFRQHESITTIVATWYIPVCPCSESYIDIRILFKIKQKSII